jgi:actin-related protein 10
VAEAQFLTSTKELISVPANIRWEAIEPFFVGSEMTSANSIVTSVLDVVKKSPVDIRAALLGNILLLGGTAMIPGFRERFLDQLKNDLSTDPSYANLSSLIKINGVKFVSTYFPPNMMSWIGGSVYAGTEMSRARVLEAKDFTSVDSNGTGNIPDWMSLLPFEPSSSPVEDKIEPDFY